MKKLFYYLAFTLFSFYSLGQPQPIKQQTKKPPIELPIGTPPYNPIPDNLFFSVKGAVVDLPKNVLWSQFVQQAIIEGGGIQPFPPRWKGYNGMAYKLPRTIKDRNGNVRVIDCTYPNKILIWPPDFGGPDDQDPLTGNFENVRIKNPVNLKNAGKTIYIENDILIAGKLDNKNQYNNSGTRNAFKVKLFDFNKEKLIAEIITDKSNTYCFWDIPLNIKKYPKGVWIQIIPIVVKDIEEDSPPIVEREYVSCTMELFPIDHTYLSTVTEESADLCVRGSTMRINLTKPTLNEIYSGRDLFLCLNKPIQEKLDKKNIPDLKKLMRSKIDFDFYNTLENVNTSYQFDNNTKQLVITTPVILKEGTALIIVYGQLTSYKLFDPQNPNGQQKVKGTKEWDWNNGTIFDPFGPQQSTLAWKPEKCPCGDSFYSTTVLGCIKLCRLNEKCGGCLNSAKIGNPLSINEYEAYNPDKNSNQLKPFIKCSCGKEVYARSAKACENICGGVPFGNKSWLGETVCLMLHKWDCMCYKN